MQHLSVDNIMLSSI